MRNCVYLPALCALSVAEVLETYQHKASKISEFKPILKWPNDVFFKDKKVCGVLCTSEPGKQMDGAYANLGIGVDLNYAPLQGFSTCLKDELDKNADIDVDQFVESLGI